MQACSDCKSQYRNWIIIMIGEILLLLWTCTGAQPEPGVSPTPWAGSHEQQAQHGMVCYHSSWDTSQVVWSAGPPVTWNTLWDLQRNGHYHCELLMAVGVKHVMPMVSVGHSTSLDALEFRRVGKHSAIFLLVLPLMVCMTYNSTSIIST